MMQPWKSIFDLPIGDHRNLIVEVRGEQQQTALAFWTGHSWAHVRSTVEPEDIGFTPKEFRWLDALPEDEPEATTMERPRSVRATSTLTPCVKQAGYEAQPHNQRLDGLRLFGGGALMQPDITRAWTATADVFNAVFKERLNQIAKHGYDQNHDDVANDSGEMVDAAIAYALASSSAGEGLFLYKGVQGDPAAVAAPIEAYDFYPWDPDHFRPLDNTVFENTIKAAALLIAEAERQLRAIRAADDR